MGEGLYQIFSLYTQIWFCCTSDRVTTHPCLSFYWPALGLVIGWEEEKVWSHYSEWVTTLASGRKMYSCIDTCPTHTSPHHLSQWWKVKKMQPLWHHAIRIEDSFENTQWRKVTTLGSVLPYTSLCLPLLLTRLHTQRHRQKYTRSSKQSEKSKQTIKGE